jgi:hypothetical protein
MKPLFGNVEKHRYSPDAMRSLAHIVPHDKAWVTECSSSQEDDTEEDCHHWTSQVINKYRCGHVTRGGSLWKPNICKDDAMPLFMIDGTGSFARGNPAGSECKRVIGKL